MNTDVILCGDNVTVLRGLPDACIDLTVTSPPYDKLRLYNGYTWDFEALARQLYRTTKPGGVVVWVVGDATIDGSETGTSFRQALYFKECGFNLHDTMIYAKNGPAHPDTTRYHQVFEFMFILSKGRPASVNLLTDRKNKWGGQSNFGTRTNRTKDGVVSSALNGKPIKEYGARWNIWEINNGYGYSADEDYVYEHAAIFPESLARDHILSWSNPGDLVLDPFIGSGTTAKMAKEVGRHWIGIDISAEYCKLAEKRVRGANVPLFTL